MIPVPPATVPVRHSRARPPRGRRVHVPGTPAPHRAEPMAAANPARPAAAAAAASGAGASTAALVREHAHLRGGGAAAAPWGGVAVAGARVGGARVAPPGAVAVAGVLRAPGPLNAYGGSANDVRRCVGDHGVERGGLGRGREGGREG